MSFNGSFSYLSLRYTYIPITIDGNNDINSISIIDINFLFDSKLMIYFIIWKVYLGNHTQ